MTKKVKAIPEGFHSITPYLSTVNASKAIDFYKRAFGAKEIEKHTSPDGKIMHAILKIGDSHIMLSDHSTEHKSGISDPASLKGTTILLQLYVEDVDTVFNKAVKEGAKVKMPLEDMFWGDRYGQLVDPFGHLWGLATHKEDLTPEQISEGAKKKYSKGH